MDRNKNRYLSFMLRLWSGFTEGSSGWRASLEDPETGERQGFADMQQLFVYLRERTEGGEDTQAEAEVDGP